MASPRLEQSGPSADEVIEAIFRQARADTRLLVASHITSPTAIILPMQQICTDAKRPGISICVDGRHATTQVPLALDKFPCDFYTASLRKWASAPFGSGFLYVSPKRQHLIKSPLLKRRKQFHIFGKKETACPRLLGRRHSRRHRRDIL
jgi:isopenicillin-N epimerase